MILITGNHIELPKEKRKAEEEKEGKNCTNLNDFLKLVIPTFSPWKRKVMSTPQSHPQQHACVAVTSSRGTAVVMISWLWMLSMSRKECESKGHGERNVVQHFTLCDNSQNCQNHRLVGISVIVLSLVRCNNKEWKSEGSQVGNVGRFWLLHSGIWLETYWGVGGRGSTSPKVLYLTCTSVFSRCQIWACFHAFGSISPFQGFLLNMNKIFLL